MRHQDLGATDLDGRQEVVLWLALCVASAEVGAASTGGSSPARTVVRLHGRWQRRGSRARGAASSGLKLVAIPPQHTGVDVDDEPPARSVTRIAADRPRVGHAGTGREPVVRLARSGPHRARRGAVVGE